MVRQGNIKQTPGHVKQLQNSEEASVLGEVSPFDAKRFE